MKKILITLLLVLPISLATAQNTVEIDDAKPLEWQGKAAMGGYAPEGTLEIEKIIFTLDEDQVTGLVVSVDMTSLSQENKRLERHLRNADFFDVDVFPKAVFTLTKPIPLDNGSCELEGIMTIKNNSKPEVIPAQINITDGLVIVEFNHQFDRTRYGINYNSPSIFKKLKDQAIADEFSLKTKLSFPKAKISQ